MLREENADYMHARQACYLCLNNHDGVSTETIIEYEGILWLCKSCIRDLAVTAGYSVDDDRSEQIAKLKDEVEVQRVRAEATEDMIEKIKLYETRVSNLARGREALKKASA